jgi:hypothetical protein
MIKTFVGGQIIKEFLRTVSDIIPHDNKNIISKVRSSRFIAVRRRVLETSGSIKRKHQREPHKAACYIHGVDMDFNRTEGLAALRPIKWTVAGADLQGQHNVETS